MSTDILRVAGQIAGIGGLALGVLLVLFREVIRKNIFPNLETGQAFSLLKLIVILVWTVALAGIGAWVYVTVTANGTETPEGAPTHGRMSSSLTLYQGDLPSTFASDIKEVKEEEGYGEEGIDNLVYESHRGNEGELVVRPKMAYLNNMKSDGPVLPYWLEIFNFPLPVFGVLSNNQTDHDVVLSSMELRVLKRQPTKVPWLIPSQPRYSDDKQLKLSITDYAHDDFSGGDPWITYDILPIDDSTTELISTDSAASNAELLMSLPNVEFDSEFANKSIGIPESELTEAQRERNRWQAVFGDSASFNIEKSLVPSPDIYNSAVIFGWLNYTNAVGEKRRMKFASRIFLKPPGGPGRIRPDYLYSVMIDASGPPETITIPLGQLVEAGGQDCFVFSITATEPSLMEIDVVLQSTNGDEVDLGRLDIETFSIKWQGLGPGKKEAAVPTHQIR